MARSRIADYLIEVAVQHLQRVPHGPVRLLHCGIGEDAGVNPDLLDSPSRPWQGHGARGRAASRSTRVALGRGLRPSCGQAHPRWRTTCSAAAPGGAEALRHKRVGGAAVVVHRTPTTSRARPGHLIDGAVGTAGQQRRRRGREPRDARQARHLRGQLMSAPGRGRPALSSGRAAAFAEGSAWRSSGRLGGQAPTPSGWRQLHLRSSRSTPAVRAHLDSKMDQRAPRWCTARRTCCFETFGKPRVPRRFNSARTRRGDAPLITRA